MKIAYKGFNKDWKCRDYQFAVGENYARVGKVEECASGFHACAYPLDVFDYYSPHSSVFALVKLSGEMSEGDSKIAAEKIEIVRELQIHDVVSAAVKYIFDNSVSEGASSATGRSSIAIASGKNGLVEWITLDAQFVRTHEYARAVPQRRRRVFVVRDIGDWQSRGPLFLESEGLLGNPPPSRKTREEVAGTIGARTGCSIGAQDAMNGHMVPVCMSTGQAGAEIGIGIGTTLNCNHEAPIAFIARDYGNDATRDVAPTMRSLCKGADGHQSGGAGLAVCMPINTQIATRHEAMGEDTGLGIGADGAAAYKLQAAHCHAVAYIGGIDSENNGHLMDDATGPLMKGSPTGGGRPLPAIVYRTNAAGQVMNQGDVSATINTFTDPTAQFLHHQMHVRRLTPTECARLQGFPDDHLSQVPDASDTQMYKALGNSMAVNVMRLIAIRIDNAVTLA